MSPSSNQRSMTEFIFFKQITESGVFNFFIENYFINRSKQFAIFILQKKNIKDKTFDVSHSSFFQQATRKRLVF